MQGNDAVAALIRLHLQEEFTVLTAHSDDLNLSGRGGHLHTRGGRRDGHAAILAVGFRVAVVVEAHIHRVGFAARLVNGQMQVGHRVNLRVVDGLLARELVVTVLIRSLALNTVFHTVIVPAIGFEIVFPNVAGVERAVADGHLVRFLDHEDADRDAVATVAAGNRVRVGHHALVGDVEGVVSQDLVVVLAGDMQRVGGDRVALHDVITDMQVHDAVATVGGRVLQDKVAGGGILLQYRHTRGGSGQAHSRARRHGDADAGVRTVFEGLGRIEIKAEMLVVRCLGRGLHRQLQVGHHVHLLAVDGLQTRELVVTVRIRSFTLDAVVHIVVFPAIGGVIAEIPLQQFDVVRLLAGGVLVQRLHNQNARRDAVATVGSTARDGVDDGVGAGCDHIEGLVGEDCRVRRARIERVLIDRFALHHVVVHVQVHDAVATVDGFISQDKVASGRIHSLNHDIFRGSGGHRHAGCADGDGDVLILAVSLRIGLLIEADVLYLVFLVLVPDGQVQEGRGVNGHAVHNLAAVMDVVTGNGTHFEGGVERSERPTFLQRTHLFGVFRIAIDHGELVLADGRIFGTVCHLCVTLEGVAALMIHVGSRHAIGSVRGTRNSGLGTARRSHCPGVGSRDASLIGLGRDGVLDGQGLARDTGDLLAIDNGTGVELWTHAHEGTLALADAGGIHDAHVAGDVRGTHLHGAQIRIGGTGGLGGIPPQAARIVGSDGDFVGRVGTGKLRGGHGRGIWCH